MNNLICLDLKKDLELECEICLDEFKHKQNVFLTRCCNTYFHKDCLLDSISVCPHCRDPLNRKPVGSAFANSADSVVPIVVVSDSDSDSGFDRETQSVYRAQQRYLRLSNVQGSQRDSMYRRNPRRSNRIATANRKKENDEKKKPKEKVTKKQQPTVTRKTPKVAGFMIPVCVSSELADFLNIEPNTKVVRSTVTKRIAEYIRVHDLYSLHKGKKIIKPDKKLKSLLGPPIHYLTKRKPELGKGYCYQNLQSYLAPHYKKTNS